MLFTSTSGVRIVRDDLTGPRIARFLTEHLEQMRAVTPPESVHALDLDALRRTEVTFWSALDEEVQAGCGALKEIGAGHGEIKSMRTAPEYQGRGVGTLVLAHIIGAARARGMTRLSLETGSFDFFRPARRLYEKAGFEYCPPFEGYTQDPNSVYLTRAL